MKRKISLVLLTASLLLGSGMACYASSGYGARGGGSFGFGGLGPAGGSSSSGNTYEKTSETPAEEKISAEVIRTVQEVLNEKGFSCGVADGIMGENTISAIEKYQEENGLNVSGKINAELLESMQIDEAGNRIIISVDEIQLELQAQIEELTAKVALLEQENNELRQENSELKSEIEVLRVSVLDKEEEPVTKVEHYCEVEDCYREGTKSIIGFSGLTEYYCSEHYAEMEEIWDMLTEDSDYSDRGNKYDPSDPYYSANDADGDGYLTDEEWQNAMGDFLDDLASTYEY